MSSPTTDAPLRAHTFQGEPFSKVLLMLDDSAESSQVRELLESWEVPYAMDLHPGVHPRLPALRLDLEDTSFVFRGRREIATLFLPGVRVHRTASAEHAR